jgi:hypothetical protein
MGKKRTLQVYVGRTAVLVDFKQLQKQKATLDSLRHSFHRSEDLEGLLSFLDAFQDEAADMLGAKAVFGKGA